MIVLNHANMISVMISGLNRKSYGLMINWIKHNSYDKFGQICIKNFLEKKSLT